MGYPHNSAPTYSDLVTTKTASMTKKWNDHPHGAPDFCSAFYFLVKEIVESCTEINSLWGNANLFGCFEVLVLKNRFKQLTLLNFYKNLKNQRKLDDFSGSKDFDCKNTHVKIISLILNTVSSCAEVISVSQRIFVVMWEAVFKNLGVPVYSLS